MTSIQSCFNAAATPACLKKGFLHLSQRYKELSFADWASRGVINTRGLSWDREMARRASLNAAETLAISAIYQAEQQEIYRHG
jgi:hypothetical protein